MNFDLSGRVSNFPQLDNEFRDDADKLHSDLVGISLDGVGVGGVQDDDEDDDDVDNGQWGMWSLQVEGDPRRQRRQNEARKQVYEQ